MEPFVGEIKAFAFNFAPRNYALCNGQLLSIAQNTALFSLLGTMYGGDGRVTFGLPNLQGRAPMHFGTGSPRSERVIGETGGETAVTLTPTQMPAHSHAMQATNRAPDDNDPGGQYPGPSGNLYATAANPSVSMATESLSGYTGGNQPHTNLQPYLAINYCIALAGIFPPRP